MAERDDEVDPDRTAILARRRAFIVHAMTGLDGAALGSKTKLVALAVSGLTTACPRPCLNDVGSSYEMPEDEGTGESNDETRGTEGTGTSTESSG